MWQAIKILLRGSLDGGSVLNVNAQRCDNLSCFIWKLGVFWAVLKQGFMKVNLSSHTPGRKQAREMGRRLGVVLL